MTFFTALLRLPDHTDIFCLYSLGLLHISSLIAVRMESGIVSEIYLIRHGETVWNRENRFLGDTDLPLSEKGIWQAERLSDRLRKVPLCAVYTSPLKRAIQTAERIAAPHSLRPVVVTGLKEIGYGEWEGLTLGEVEEKFSHLEKQRRADPIGFQAPGGESFKAFICRVVDAFSRIVRENHPGPVAVVAHQTVNRILITFTLRAPWSVWRRWRQDCGCVNVIEVTPDGRWRLCLINDACHLDSDE